MTSPRKLASRQESTEDSSGHEEDLSAIIGRTGPFHREMLAYAMFATAVFSLHAMVYVTSRPELVSHWCQLPDTPPNTTIEEWKELNIPKEEDGTYSHCLVYVRPTGSPPEGNETSESRPCTTRFFDVPGGTLSIVQEWDLVCERQWLFYAINLVFLVGSFFGLIVSGLLADRIGRRPVVCFSAMILEVVGVSMYSVENFVLFLALRFVIGATVSALCYTSYVLLVEFVALPYRALYGTTTYCGFNVGLLLGIFILGLVHEWRNAQLAIMLPTAVLLTSIWILPESPRWLITTLQIRYACMVVSLVLRKNGMTPKFIRVVCKRIRAQPSSILFHKDAKTNMDEAKTSSSRRGGMGPELEHQEKSVWDLLVIFGTQYQRSGTVLCLCWFSCSVTYYGIGMYVSAASVGNITRILIESAAPVAAYFLIVRRGRRSVLAGSLALTCASCVPVAVMPRDHVETYFIVMVAWFSINLAYTVVFLYAAELYPTTIRALGFNLSAAFGRIGTLFAMIYGESITEKYEWRLAVFAVFSLSCGVTGFLVTKLPETKEAHLPERIRTEQNLFEFAPMQLSDGRRHKESRRDTYAEAWADTATAPMSAAFRLFAAMDLFSSGGNRSPMLERLAAANVTVDEQTSISCVGSKPAPPVVSGERSSAEDTIVMTSKQPLGQMSETKPGEAAKRKRQDELYLLNGASQHVTSAENLPDAVQPAPELTPGASPQSAPKKRICAETARENVGSVGLELKSEEDTHRSPAERDLCKTESISLLPNAAGRQPSPGVEDGSLESAPLPELKATEWTQTIPGTPKPTRTSPIGSTAWPHRHVSDLEAAMPPTPRSLTSTSGSPLQQNSAAPSGVHSPVSSEHASSGAVTPIFAQTSEGISPHKQQASLQRLRSVDVSSGIDSGNINLPATSATPSSLAETARTKNSSLKKKIKKRQRHKHANNRK